MLKSFAISALFTMPVQNMPGRMAVFVRELLVLIKPTIGRRHRAPAGRPMVGPSRARDTGLQIEFHGIDPLTFPHTLRKEVGRPLLRRPRQDYPAATVSDFAPPHIAMLKMQIIGIMQSQHAGMPDVGTIDIAGLGHNDMQRASALAGIMAEKHEPLAEASAETATPQAGPTPTAHERASPLAPSRRGRKALTVHVDLDTHVRLKVMAAREVTTLEALVGEALDLLFATRHDRLERDTDDRRHVETAIRVDRQMPSTTCSAAAARRR